MAVRRSKLVTFIKRWRLLWAWVTLVLYIAAIPATVIIFPSSSLWLAVLVLFTGITSTMVTIGDMLVTAEDAALKDPNVNE